MNLCGCQWTDLSSEKSEVTAFKPTPTEQSLIASPTQTKPALPIIPTSPSTPVYLIADLLPEKVESNLTALEGVEWVLNEDQADYALILDDSAQEDEEYFIEWIFAVAAAFPTVQDEISMRDLVDCWQGGEDCDFRLMVSSDTLPIFSRLWGQPDHERVLVVAQTEMLQRAWQDRDLRAILPFEQIEPRWKILRLDGISPLDQNFDRDRYGLTLRWALRRLGDSAAPPALKELSLVTNRDDRKFTSLILTGTTALARQTAERMEVNGVDYPLAKIGDWLKSADFAHISNEVSFYQSCPPAVPVRGGQRFCSNPDYIDLFLLAGIDVVELTGNHLLDWGIEPFLFTLDLYREKGIRYYGGGRNLAEARQPLLLEHHGNRLALIGCNRAGPENIWATEERGGPAPCEMDWLAEQIQSLTQRGYLPVVTFQHYEVEDFMPMNITRQEFEETARMGAVIVSGSQAHFAHGFGFYEDHFMHYGLGNLFFDQMFPLHRRQFLDRHIFYDGKYLGVELLTAILEDSAQPRPMTAEERAAMLVDYFAASGWLEVETK